ncbi:hypothetical protein ACFS32_25240 [Novosphingobium pokkalii]|uniref:hypothetical protein n=1 Tax=Novosphingobium pokkalii TaxID=1770194 RepID=UPI00362A35F9
MTRGLRQAANIARELRLQLMLADVDCRFVVGTVDIQTPINAERAWNMMGPGLAEARTKLSEKRLESLYAFSLPREPATQALLDAVGAGLTATERRWTKIQLHDIAHTLLGKSAQDIAQIRNVTAHSVYKVRAAGDFDSYILQWNRLLEALDIMDEGALRRDDADRSCWGLLRDRAARADLAGQHRLPSVVLGYGIATGDSGACGPSACGQGYRRAGAVAGWGRGDRPKLGNYCGGRRTQDYRPVQRTR